MPAAIAIPLIIGAASTGASVYAAKKQAQASKQASDVQVQASDKGMQYQQQQQKAAMDYAERMRTLPTQGPPAGGAQSYLSQLMHIPGATSTPSGAPPMASSAGYQFQPAMGAAASGTGAGNNLGYAGLMGGASGGAQGGTVMIQAPNGQTKAVPADQADHYISMGGKRIS